MTIIISNPTLLSSVRPVNNVTSTPIPSASSEATNITAQIGLVIQNFNNAAAIAFNAGSKAINKAFDFDGNGVIQPSDAFVAQKIDAILVQAQNELSTVAGKSGVLPTNATSAPSNRELAANFHGVAEALSAAYVKSHGKMTAASGPLTIPEQIRYLNQLADRFERNPTPTSQTPIQINPVHTLPINTPIATPVSSLPISTEVSGQEGVNLLDSPVNLLT